MPIASALEWLAELTPAESVATREAFTFDLGRQIDQNARALNQGPAVSPAFQGDGLVASRYPRSTS
jgi:hypothetical protein